MSLRIFSNWGIAAVGALALAACSDNPVAEGQGGASTAEAARSSAAAQSADTIPCALNGATETQTVCKHSVIGSGDATQLLLEGPEGDFRRFTILTDGRGLEPSDGAEPATIKLLDGGKIEVAVGDDIFVLPAKVKPSVADALPAEDEEKPSEPTPDSVVAPAPQ